MRRRPSRATVALIAGNAGISSAAARQALLAHEKNGTVTRVKGSLAGITDTWTPATTPEAPRDEDPLADARQPADEAAGDQGRRIRSTCPATRPGALRDLVEEHLRKFPGTAFTPHQVGKVLDPVGRRGRQRPRQAGQPRHRRDGHRQAPHLPARPRRPGTRPRRGRGDPAASAETAASAA